MATWPSATTSHHRADARARAVGGAGRLGDAFRRRRQAIAELMTHGETEWDIRGRTSTASSRTIPRAYMTARVDRQYQEVYDIIHPLQPMEKPRNVRLAPFHQRLVEQQGVFLPAPAGRCRSGTMRMRRGGSVRRPHPAA